MRGSEWDLIAYKHIDKFEARLANPNDDEFMSGIVEDIVEFISLPYEAQYLICLHPVYDKTINRLEKLADTYGKM